MRKFWHDLGRGKIGLARFGLFFLQAGGAVKLSASFPTLARSLLRRCWTFAYVHGLEEKLDFNIVGNPIESMYGRSTYI